MDDQKTIYKAIAVWIICSAVIFFLAHYIFKV